jgi:hypothetical protein
MGRGAIRLTEGGTASCPMTAWCYAQTGRIFEAWQLYDPGQLLGWTKLKGWVIALVAELAVVPARSRVLRTLARELFAADAMQLLLSHGLTPNARVGLSRHPSSQQRQGLHARTSLPVSPRPPPWTVAATSARSQAASIAATTLMSAITG